MMSRMVADTALLRPRLALRPHVHGTPARTPTRPSPPALVLDDIWLFVCKTPHSVNKDFPL